MTLNRPPQLRFNPAHPLSNHCIAAWFFGPEKDSVTDYGPCYYNGAHDATGFVNYDYTPQGPAIETLSGRYAIGSTVPGDAISLVGASAVMFSFRARYGPSSNTFAKIADRSTSGNGANGWSIGMLDYSPNLGVIFYTNGSQRLANITDILQAPLIANYGHFVLTARMSGTASDPGNGIWVDRVAYDQGSGALGAAPSTTVAVSIGNESGRNRPFVGGIEHMIVYRKDAPGALFTLDEVRSVFDDPYAPFRPELPLAAFTIAAVAPPSEFEPHRMHFGTAS